MKSPTMQAMVTTEWNQLELQERSVPEPETGQVRIRTILTGVCGSDLHIFQGHHPTAIAPVVQGHEAVGMIDAIGADVDGFQVGERVVVEPLVSCGTCEACRRGLVHVCRQLKLLGIHQDGAFAEYFLAPAKKVIAVPDSLNDSLAALAEPFAVGVHVCRRAELEPGSRALIVGAGPIGLIIAMVAQFSGAEVTLAEIDQERLKQAREFGFATVDAGKDNATSAAIERTDGDGFDNVFEVSGSAGGVGLAIETARMRGRIVQVGFFSEVPRADLFKLTLKELALVGSRVYSNEDFRRTVRVLDELAQQGKYDLEKMISEKISLTELNGALERMKAGQIAGKVLIAPSQ